MSELLSIVVPLYNEEGNVTLLVQEIREVLDGKNIPFEVILVDDGSSDGTFARIKSEALHDKRVTGLRLSRNQGQTTAIKAGMEHARGAVCITMDGDLQHDPRHIPEFLSKINEGFDLVCSYRHGRKDALTRRLPSRAANWVARIFSGLQIRDFGSTYRAYRTAIAKDIPIYGEMHRFIPVFMKMRTERITEIPITVEPRRYGHSNYGLGRTFRVFADLVAILFFARFFSRPIHIFGYISLILGLPGIVILGWLSAAKLAGYIRIMDYGPLFVLGVLLCLVAVQMLTTGIVCEYLVRIYYGGTEKKSYIVAEKISRGDHE